MAEYNAVFCGADLHNIYPICEKVIELVFKSKKCDLFTAVITGDQMTEFADRLTARFAERVRVIPVVRTPETQVTEAAAARDVVLQNVGYLDLVLVQPAAFGCVSFEPGDQYFQNCVHQFLNVTENLLSLLKPKGRFVNLTLPYIVPQFQNCSRKIQKMLLSSKLNRELLYALAHRYAEAIRSKTFEIDQWSNDYVVMAHVFCYAAILMINRDRNLELDRISPNCNSGCLIYSVAPSLLPHLKTGLDDTHNKEIADALAGEFTKPDKICGSVLIGQHAVPLNCKLEELGNLLGGVESTEWSFSLTEHLINPLLYHRSSEFSSLPGQSQFEPYSLCSASSSSFKKEPMRCPCQNCTCELAVDCGASTVCKCTNCPCRSCQCQACSCTAVVECKNECRCPACECRTCECTACNCGRYNHCAVSCRCKDCACKISDCNSCNCCVKVGENCADNCVCMRCKCNNICATQSIDSQDQPEELRVGATKPEQVMCCADSHKCTCKNCCFNQPDGSTRSLKEGCICSGTNVCQTADEKMKNMYVATSVNYPVGATEVKVTTQSTLQVSENVAQQHAVTGGSASVHSSQGHVHASHSSHSKSQPVSGDMANLVTANSVNTTSMQAVTSNHASASMSQHSVSHKSVSQHSTGQVAKQTSLREAEVETMKVEPEVVYRPPQKTWSAGQENITYHHENQVLTETRPQMITETRPQYEQTNIQQPTPQHLGAQFSTGPVNVPTEVITGSTQQVYTHRVMSQTSGVVNEPVVPPMPQTASLGITQLTNQVSPATSGSQTDTNLLNKALSPLAPAAVSSLILQTGVNTNTSQFPGFTRSYSGSPLNSREIGGYTTLQTSKSQVSAMPAYQQAQTTTTTTTTMINQTPSTVTNVQQQPIVYQQSTGNVQQNLSHQGSSQHSSAQVPQTSLQQSSSNVQQISAQQSSTSIPVMTTQQSYTSVPQTTVQQGVTTMPQMVTQTSYMQPSPIAGAAGIVPPQPPVAYRTIQSQVSGNYKETSRIYTETTATINQTGEVIQPSVGVTVSQPGFQQSFITTTTTQQNRMTPTETAQADLKTISNAQCLTISNKSQTACSLSDFTAAPVPRATELAENELSVKLEYLATNYWLIARAQVGDQVRTRGLARVLQSRNSQWVEGDILCDDFPWVDGEFCHTPSVCARKYNPKYAPDVYLSAYSDDAISAQMLLKACNAEFGKTLIVNECVSPIAYLTCLFAKRVLNMAVIAVSSVPQACQVLKEQIGVNICINTMNCVAGVDLNTLEGQKVAYTKYLNELRAALAQLGTSHVDCVIENHGGYQLDAHLALLNEQTHIAFCGLASSGNGQVSSDPHEQYAYKNLNSLFKTSSSIRGCKSPCTDALRDLACSVHVAELVKTFYDQTDRMMVQPDLRIPQVTRVDCEGGLSDALKVLVHVVNSPTPAKSCVLKLAE